MGSQFWLARIPCICFWIVAWHYPDRVMRQFGLFQVITPTYHFFSFVYCMLFLGFVYCKLFFQVIPPPSPNSWTELNALNKVVHTARCNTDWSTRHATYVNMWHNPYIIQEQRPYDESTYRDYRRWYQGVGLYKVFIRGQVICWYELFR